MISRAKQMMEQSDEELMSMDQLAATLRVSPAQFRRLFKQHTGMSPYQYYLQVRINRAKEMLHGTTLQIKQFASALKFERPYHFSKAFKLKTGVSPTQWRTGAVSKPDQ